MLAENIEPVARACRLGTWGHLWKLAQENARRADALETKGDELAGLFQRLRDELGNTISLLRILWPMSDSRVVGLPFTTNPIMCCPKDTVVANGSLR